ncbi:MAG TPA: hypothetical protein P5169_00945 [Kiritimatiellia bacterium]|nr:hypothetical protein [Kiritimatiellia bacterium]
MATWYDEAREAQARAYERDQGGLYLLRFGLLFALAALFWVSGWSQALANGLRNWFSFPVGRWVVHPIFIALTVFAYEAVLFPLSVLANFSLERAYQRLEGEFGEWFRGYLLTLLFEMGIFTVGFMALYVLRWFAPSVWWLGATALYVVLVGGLGEWASARILPRVRPPVVVEAPELLAELQRIGRAAHLKIEGVAWWDFADQEDLPDVRVAGSGRHRQIIFSAAAWRRLGASEQLFLAARAMKQQAGKAILWMYVWEAALAAAVFWGAGRVADAAARARGLNDGFALEALPFLVVALFACAAAASLVAHAIRRRLDLRADRFALREVRGGAEVLRRCLAYAFEREPFAVSPPLWQVWLLHPAASATERLQQAQTLALGGKETSDV